MAGDAENDKNDSGRQEMHERCWLAGDAEKDEKEEAEALGDDENLPVPLPLRRRRHPLRRRLQFCGGKLRRVDCSTRNQSTEIEVKNL